jgi:hypothetical protein
VKLKCYLLYLLTEVLVSTILLDSFYSSGTWKAARRQSPHSHSSSALLLLVVYTLKVSHFLVSTITVEIVYLLFLSY